MAEQRKDFFVKKFECGICESKFFTEKHLSRHVRVEHETKDNSRPFKYVEKPPRKQAERKTLQGHTCRECEAYYRSVPDGEARIQSHSRHRGSLYDRPKTPEHYWELDIPDTPEAIRRGYVNPEVEVVKFGRKNRYDP